MKGEMREIKFRQPLKRGGFHYWGYVGKDNHYFVSPCGPLEEASPSEQFTGLRDNYAVDIYEGDVVKYQGWEVSMGRQKRPDRLVVVGDGYKTKNQFGDPLPQGNWIDDCYHLQNIIDGGSPLEVIGNVHDNPEMEVSR